jgi:hypothetical protein
MELLAKHEDEPEIDLASKVEVALWLDHSN